MGQIITPNQIEPLTTEQQKRTVKEEEMPPCEANPNQACMSSFQPMMIAGYDDKMRCPTCHRIHVELVMEEAGNSPPNTEPQFVSPKLDKRARTERQARMDSLYDKLEAKGHSGRPSRDGTTTVKDGDPVDMKDAMTKDEFKTREQGISNEERRQRILAKYSKRTTRS
jgi:hypothetical protein